MRILSASAVAPYHLSEKASLTYENGKSGGVKIGATPVSLPFTQEDITQTLSSLLAFAKLWATLPHTPKKKYALFKKACVHQAKALIIKPELSIVKATSVEVVLSVAQEKPLTAQRMRKLLDRFPEAYATLKEGRHLLTGQTLQEKRKVDQLFGQYKGLLKQLEVTMQQGWYQAVRQEKTNALASASSLSCFTDEQVDTLTRFVSSLSTFSEKIKQSSQSLCEIPSLRALRFWCGLITAIGSIAAVSLAIAGATFFPVISLCVAILSATIHIGTYLYEKYKLKPEAQEWKERLNTLTNFTEQLKNLKETAMAANLSIHGAALSTHEAALSTHGTALSTHGTRIATQGTQINQHGATLSVQGTKINQLDTKQHTHDQEIQDLKTIIFEMKAELEILRKEKAIEEQPKASDSDSTTLASQASKHKIFAHC